MQQFIGASTANKYWLSLSTEKSDSPLAKKFLTFATALTQPIRNGSIKLETSELSYRILSYDDQFQSAAAECFRMKLADFNFGRFDEFKSFPFSTQELGFVCKDGALLFNEDPTRFGEALLPLLMGCQEDFFLEIQTHSEDLSQINAYVYHIRDIVSFSEGGFEANVIYSDSTDAEALFLSEGYTGREKTRSWDEFWQKPLKLRTRLVNKVRRLLPWAK